jgi:alpha-beta hydrolase superfamily lysophospholipase
MIHLEGEWIAQDGIKIYWQEWKPETVTFCGVVLLVHGLGEHSGRYTHVAEAFTRSGYVLFAFDHRGHGQSDGVRGDETIAATSQDITHFLEEIEQTVSSPACHPVWSQPGWSAGFKLRPGVPARDQRGDFDRAGTCCRERCISDDDSDG